MQKGSSTLITLSDRVCQAAHNVPDVASLLEKVLYLTQHRVYRKFLGVIHLEVGVIHVHFEMSEVF